MKYATAAPAAEPKALSESLTVLRLIFSERMIRLSNFGAICIVMNLVMIPTIIIPNIAMTVISFKPRLSAASAVISLSLMIRPNILLL